MKLIPRLSLVCLLVALPAFAQSVVPPPSIATIQPSVAGTSGGTIVTITGSNLSLPPSFACIIPCPTLVRFGGAQVEAIHEENSWITIRTPAHAEGTVDVTVTTGDGRSATVQSAFTFVADSHPGYAAFLLPVYLDGNVPGDRGSLWTTDFWIRNNSANDVLLAPWDCPPNQACPAVVPLTYTLRPGENLMDLPAFLLPPSSNPGRLLYVTRGAVDRVSTSLRVFDTSRDDLDAGAELPVVREEDLHTSTVDLLSVPLDANFRLHLRIYETAQTESTFRVRIFAQEEGVFPNPSPIREVTVTATSVEEGPFRVRPAYAEYTDFASLLELDIPLERLRIEVVPETPGSVFWPFVSITNNETQRLTIVTP